MLKEVRCCCKPENIRGYLPSNSNLLPLRELTDGSYAFSSEEKTDEELSSLREFIPCKHTDRKTWKDSKTWRKK